MISLANFARDCPFLVVAHRGCSAACPENTIPAFDAAVKDGAHMIELDARMAADGEFVVIHDDRLDRTTAVEGMVASLPSDSLAMIDAGTWFAPRFSGAAIPTLNQVFSRYRDKIYLNVEFKDNPHPHDLPPMLSAEKMVQTLYSWKMSDMVLVSSFNLNFLQCVHDICPSVKIGYLADGYIATTDDMETMVLEKAFSAHPEIGGIASSAVESLQNMGIRVVPWCRQSRQDDYCHEMACRLSADGLIANNPKRLIELLK